MRPSGQVGFIFFPKEYPLDGLNGYSQRLGTHFYMGLNLPYGISLSAVSPNSIPLDLLVLCLRYEFRF